jgi:putative SOS response-associated peptidase YedK
MQNAALICHNLVVMCGRYRLSRRKQIVEEYCDCVSDEPDWTPRYNIAPTQPIPVILQNPREPIRELSLMRWGLIPRWAKKRVRNGGGRPIHRGRHKRRTIRFNEAHLKEA